MGRTRPASGWPKSPSASVSSAPSVVTAGGTRPRLGVALPQLYRLENRAVSGGVPGCEADPFLTRRRKWDLEAMAAERRQFSRRHDFPAGGVAVAPHHFDEL